MVALTVLGVVALAFGFDDDDKNFRAVKKAK